MLTTDYINNNIDITCLNIHPINICFTSNKQTIYFEYLKLYKLLIPSFEMYYSSTVKKELINMTDYDISFSDNILLSHSNNEIISCIIEFLKYCRLSDQEDQLITMFEYLKMIIKDNIILWLIVSYGINSCNLKNIPFFLIKEKKQLEKTKMLLLENIFIINKYICFYRTLLCPSYREEDMAQSIKNEWTCKTCTFENTHIIKRLCEICETNRFI
jgi:hypothetical protein